MSHPNMQDSPCCNVECRIALHGPAFSATIGTTTEPSFLCRSVLCPTLRGIKARHDKIGDNRMMPSPPAAASQVTRSLREPELRSQVAEPLIHVNGLEKTYRTARGPLTLFKDLDLQVETGELVAIVGQSGAGKSTL